MAAWAYYFAQPEPEQVAPTTTALSGATTSRSTCLPPARSMRSTVVNVGAEVSGRIDALHVELGQDGPKKGELIAEIDPLDKQNALQDCHGPRCKNNQAQKRIQEANAESRPNYAAERVPKG